LILPASILSWSEVGQSSRARRDRIHRGVGHRREFYTSQATARAVQWPVTVKSISIRQDAEFGVRQLAAAAQNRSASPVFALRAEGFDVLAVSEIMTQSNDRELIQRANAERRILLTEEKDFGWLVFISYAESAGVILIRFPGNARQTMSQAVVQVIHEQADKLFDAFVVVQPGHIRISFRP
jgi:predicted nuclease of predicted toxin-antitoxin system